MDQISAMHDTVELARRRGMPLREGTDQGLEHMVSMAERMGAGFSDAKLGRWLGWAQCLAFCEGVLSLQDCKQINLARTDHRRTAPGDLVELIEMPDDPQPVPQGSRGTVLDVLSHLDQIAVDWENGRSLAIVPSVDRFAVIDPVLSGHRFDGSSSQLDAFRRWFDGQRFVAPAVSTRDLRELALPDGGTARPGDHVFLRRSGDFVAVPHGRPAR